MNPEIEKLRQRMVSHDKVVGLKQYPVDDIKKGEKFTLENVRSIRPSNGLHPKYYEDVLGKVAKQDLVFGTPLKKEYID